MLDPVRELAERGRAEHLALLLERAHAIAIGLRRAADQQHRPAILLGVGEAGDAVDDARAGHRDARARTAGQKADRARGIRRRLLVAHADIGDAVLLRGLGQRSDREPDDPEHVFDALLLKAFRQKVRAGDFCHIFLPKDRQVRFDKSTRQRLRYTYPPEGETPIAAGAMHGVKSVPRPDCGRGRGPSRER